MTSFMELVDRMDGRLCDFPWMVDFRLGGDTIGISDEVTISISRVDGLYSGEINRKSGSRPYLHGTLRYAEMPGIGCEVDALAGMLQEPVRVKSSFIIPVFSRMIIYRKHCQHPRLSRTFELRETESGRTYMMGLRGGVQGLMDCGDMNTIRETHVHPGVLVTILDETLGWAGFLAVWQGGVTVNLSAHFLQPVTPGDKVFSLGCCSSIRGGHRRKLVSCAGGLFIVRGEEIVPAVYATGRWLTDPGYKQKMLRYIMP
jgi:hypothetical protein